MHDPTYRTSRWWVVGALLVRRKDLEARCTPIESAIQCALMRGNTVRVRRRSWTAIGGALALVAIAGFAVACHRESPNPPPPPSPTKSQPPPDAQRPANARPFPDPTFLVLVWMETTPPGARIVRVSDGHVFGYTPEIVEFHQSIEPEVVRFDLAGYIPVTREVSAASDGELKIALKPIPKKHAPATKQSKGSSEHRN
jgi:hypothetical protein